VKLPSWVDTDLLERIADEMTLYHVHDDGEVDELGFDVVDNTVGGREEREDDHGNRRRGEEVRHHVDGLDVLGQSSGTNLVEDHGQNNSQRGIEKNEYDVVGNGIAGDHPCIGGPEQELEVLQTDELGAEDTLAVIELLEGHDDTELGQVTEHEDDSHCRQGHEVQNPIVPHVFG